MVKDDLENKDLGEVFRGFAEKQDKIEERLDKIENDKTKSYEPPKESTPETLKEAIMNAINEVKIEEDERPTKIRRKFRSAVIKAFAKIFPKTGEELFSYTLPQSSGDVFGITRRSDEKALAFCYAGLEHQVKGFNGVYSPHIEQLRKLRNSRY